MQEALTGPEIIKKLLSGGSCSAEELDHLYRHLSKQTHPDLTGSDGEAFIRLRETYLKAREHLGASPATGPPPFDPFRVIREAGFEAVPAPRINLYIVLRRFFQTGLHLRKIRNNPAALRRAAEILQAIGFWAERYSPPAADIVNGYLDHGADFMNTTKQFKDYSFGRRLFIQGADLFFRYQANGKALTASLAKEKLNLSAVIIERSAGADHPTASFARWFLDELEKPPLMLEGL